MNKVKLWVDDKRFPPNGYIWIKSVKEGQSILYLHNKILGEEIEVLDLDHDAGDYFKYGGDYINLIDYVLNEDIPVTAFKIHSMNPVGRENMKRTLLRNNLNLVED